MNNYYTYAYLREDSTPYYIGKGKGYRAFRKNRKGVMPPKDVSRILFLKQNLTEEEAFKHEKYMITVFGRKDLGTGILRNLTEGGDGVSGLIHTEEIRKKISERTKEAMNTDEMRKKLSDGNRGKIRSKEFKMHLSKINKGRKHSKESKRKIGDASKSRTHSVESKIKMSESQKGIMHSEETKDKISESHKGKRRSIEHRQNISEAKKGEKNPNYNKKWWNDGFTNKMSVDCPGDGWFLGRKMKKDWKEVIGSKND